MGEGCWFWWAGFDGEVECEGLYTLGEFDTRDEAIAAGMAGLPDVDGNSFFHIIDSLIDFFLSCVFGVKEHKSAIISEDRLVATHK